MLLCITLFLLDLAFIDDSCLNQSLENCYFPTLPLASLLVGSVLEGRTLPSWAFVYFMDLLLLWVPGFPSLLSGL